MKVNTFYVYELWNPISNTVFYVGKGTKYNNSYYRLSNHIKDSKYALTGKISMNHKFRTILKILDSGQKPIIKIVFESSDKDEITTREIELIKLYGRRDIGTGILCNHTDGGEGMLGYKHTDSHKKKLREDNKGGKATARVVYGICPKTATATRYDSCNNAAKIVGGLRSNIHQCATAHKNRTAYGYYWRFESDYDIHENFDNLNELRDNSYSNSKAILQYSLTNSLLKEWKSASDVCRFYGNSVSTLHPYLKNGKPWKNSIWRFKI